jgi:hypothetical protein
VIRSLRDDIARTIGRALGSALTTDYDARRTTVRVHQVAAAVLTSPEMRGIKRALRAARQNVNCCCGDCWADKHDLHESVVAWVESEDDA